MSEEVAVTESSGPSESSQEFVALPEASDADIDAFLEASRNQPDDAEEVDEPSEAPRPEQKASKEPPAQEQPKEAPKRPDPSKQPTQEQWAAACRQLEQQEQFIHRRNHDVGELRKQLHQAKEKLSQGQEEEWLNSPKDAVETREKIKQIDSELAQLNVEEQRNTLAKTSREVLRNSLQPGEFNVEAAAATLAEDGVDPVLVEQFKRDPFVMAQPMTLVHLFKRASAEHMVKRVFPILSTLLEENKQLKAAAAEGPGRVLQNVSRELKKGPSLNGSQPGSASKGASVSSADVSKMSDAELDALLKRA